jgi:hypothetical protein
MIELVPLPPRRPNPHYAPPQAVFAVYDDDRLIGQVCEVEPLRWWFKTGHMRHFAPAAGPSQRDCVLLLERLAALPPPPRRGIPPTLKIAHVEVPDE